MAWSWGGAGSGAAMGSLFGPIGTGLGGLFGGLFGGGSKNKNASYISPMDMYAQIIDQYSYKPQYTGQTEKGLFDLFQQLTGQRGGAEQIPFDIGLPTTGLYDSMTRGIKEDYLGTPGGPEGGRIADLRSYYNNLGVPEQAINQERLANRDLNNTLTDSAARINESQKDRLTNILNMGLGTGQNLYGQNLAMHRANAGLGMAGALNDAEINNAIMDSNYSSIYDLLNPLANTLGYGNSNPTTVSKGGASSNPLSGLLNIFKPYTAKMSKGGV